MSNLKSLWFWCPRCKTRFSVDQGLQGKRARCNLCDIVFLLSDDPTCPPLLPLQNEDNPVVLESRNIHGLGEVDYYRPNAVQHLIEWAERKEATDHELSLLVQAIGKMEVSDDAVGFLIKMLGHSNEYVRHIAICSLGMKGQSAKGAIPLLRRKVGHNCNAIDLLGLSRLESEAAEEAIRRIDPTNPYRPSLWRRLISSNLIATPILIMLSNSISDSFHVFLKTVAALLAVIVCAIVLLCVLLPSSLMEVLSAVSATAVLAFFANLLASIIAKGIREDEGDEEDPTHEWRSATGSYRWRATRREVFERYHGRSSWEKLNRQTERFIKVIAWVAPALAVILFIVYVLPLDLDQTGHLWLGVTLFAVSFVIGLVTNCTF